jgi:hypothetical protein
VISTILQYALSSTPESKILGREVGIAGSFPKSPTRINRVGRVFMVAGDNKMLDEPKP